MLTMIEEKEYILYKKSGKVATIVLNRPKSLNALNTALLTELRDALADAEADAEVHAIVITGAPGMTTSPGSNMRDNTVPPIYEVKTAYSSRICAISTAALALLLPSQQP